jgi:hypothetical protein
MAVMPSVGRYAFERENHAFGRKITPALHITLSSRMENGLLTGVDL